MEYKHLGRTGLMVSPICLGTMNFGPFTSEEDSYAIMDRALAGGVNFFDTADVYGRVPGEGVTEQIIGRWLAQGGGRRDNIVLATKVYNPMVREGESDPNRGVRNLSAAKIIKHCDDSLRRLQTDHIDLYQMHHIDRACPWDEIWQAMETLVTQGKVIYVGSSNFAGWDIATANQIASNRHFLGLVSEQSIYNLDNRAVELEVIPACRHYGLGFIAWSPLAGGILAGAMRKARAGRRADDSVREKIESKRSQLRRFENLCRRLGENPATIGLAWLLHNPVVTAPIIGPRTMKHLEDSLHVPDVRLDEKTLKKLDEIFPGPGGEAPKAYAW
ncbi:MAG: aldo/keto reductase [Verrucomicrobia bacterium]|nr:MAG: aldo/keto reductase [Verrucomicrobiota bacterium]